MRAVLGGHRTCTSKSFGRRGNRGGTASTPRTEGTFPLSGNSHWEASRRCQEGQTPGYWILAESGFRLWRNFFTLLHAASGLDPDAVAGGTGSFLLPREKVSDWAAI